MRLHGSLHKSRKTHANTCGTPCKPRSGTRLSHPDRRELPVATPLIHIQNFSHYSSITFLSSTQIGLVLPGHAPATAYPSHPSASAQRTPCLVCLAYSCRCPFPGLYTSQIRNKIDNSPLLHPFLTILTILGHFDHILTILGIVAPILGLFSTPHTILGHFRAHLAPPHLF